MRKGITPIIAIIMLLLIVLSLAGGFFIWINRMWGTMGTQVANQTAGQTQSMMKQISIDSVVCNDGIVYVRNKGTKTIRDGEVTVYVNDSKAFNSSIGNISVNGIAPVDFKGYITGVVKVTGPANEDTYNC